jgi:putative intracellular protease/amidase
MPLSSFVRPLLLSCLLGAALPATFAAEALEERIAPWHARVRHERPLVAVVGENAGTELTDFVVPFGILAASGVAQVRALGVDAGPLQMRPALRIQPDATLAAFDAEHPEGADYVVVPAVADDHTADPVLLAWLRAQADKGATVVSICDGALVVANAGLLDGHRATGHWATRAQREREHPAVRWQTNVRWVADGPRVSSAGVSAAIPTALAMVEAIAGTPAATELAQRIGATDWSARHDSTPFHLGAGALLTYAGNRWFAPTRSLVVPVADGVDELALALTADAWARTLRARVQLRAPAGMTQVRTRGGLVVLAGDAATDAGAQVAPLDDGVPSLDALNQSLAAIDRQFGDGTARFVALQMEYPSVWMGR